MNSLTQYLKEVFFLLGEEKKKFPFLIFLFLISSFLDLLGIGLLAPFIAYVISPDINQSSQYLSFLSYFNLDQTTDGLILVLAPALIILFSFKALLAILVNKQILKFCFNKGVQIRSKLTEKYQNMPYTEFVERNSSEYIYSIFNLSGQFSGTILSALLKLLSELIVVSVIVIFLAVQSWQAIVILISILLIAGLFYDLFFKRKVSTYGAMANQKNTRMVQGINEAVLGLKEIRVLGKENYFHRQVYETSKASAEVTMNSVLISVIPRYLIEMILVFFILSLVLVDTIFSLEIDNFLFLLSLFGVAAIRLAPSANFIVSSITQIRFGRNCVRLLYSDLNPAVDIRREDLIPTNHENLKDEFKDLILDNVSFSYENGKKALDGISLVVKKGSSIGLIGESGSGKTTLAEIILGLITPQEGNILLNGINLENNKKALRSLVAYLPQEIFLVDGTLKENIALGEDLLEIREEDVRKAIVKSSLENFVNELPNGIDTLIGERGARISGGQRQRVALARAFYHERSVLVMDESTSALDDKTEEEIIRSISSLKGDTTTIIIAHRVSTLANCDLIIKMHEGKIIEQGSYNEIIGKGSLDVQ